MGGMTLAIYHEGVPYPVLQAWAENGSGRLRSSVRKLAGWLRNQRNPRSGDYMERLARERFPQLDKVVCVGPDRRLPEISWAEVQQVILLWPDANGIGWKPIESQCLRSLRAGGRIWILNGRRRQVELGSEVYRSLKRRRTLEVSLLLNIVTSAVVIPLAGVLWLFDLVRGRR